MKQWVKFGELEQLKETILGAFRHEQTHGDGHFQFVFYPEVEDSSITKFIAKLIAEDDVSPEHRKVIESCKNQLERTDFKAHPYYPVSLQVWKVLGLPQCQTLIIQKLFAESHLSIDFKMSRIGVARVEKKREVDGASLYTVHDFYALTGLDNPRSLQSIYHEHNETLRNTKNLRQQFDRCISAIQCVWSSQVSGIKSPKLSHHNARNQGRNQEEAFLLSSSPPL
jgi:hypothetical protein